MEPRRITIDFYDIIDIDDFYMKLGEQLELPEYFGKNLDALYDYLTGEAELPLHLELTNLSLPQLEEFEDLESTLEDVEDATSIENESKTNQRFTYSIQMENPE